MVKRVLIYCVVLALALCSSCLCLVLPFKQSNSNNAARRRPLTRQDMAKKQQVAVPPVVNMEQEDVGSRKNVDLYSSLLRDEKGIKAQAQDVQWQLSKPEVLAPAGGWPQLRAAVSNGADAVYFGLQEGFNARARASNFPVIELPEIMNYLHDRGVKGYVVVNILVFDEEMERLEDLIQKLALSGVDGLIMQDVGSVEFVRRIAPHLPIHGSTQMSITDSNGARYAQRLGVDRVVVGRELSMQEIKSVSQGSSDTEVEAFVHGALCVSYSGQCFSSEAWGGRSANRGQCAQACRMPYGLLVNGTLKDLHDVQYLLSPQDLMAVDYVPELIKAGVKSFKIEGRLKGSEYVAITTRAYRTAVDEAWNLLKQERLGIEADSATSLFKGPDALMRQDLKQVFSRGQDEEFDGLSAGFLLGVKHQNLVRGRSPRHRGLLVGRVQKVTPKGIVVSLLGPVKRGDGVVFDQGHPELQEEGGSIYDVFDEKGKSPAIKGEERSTGAAMLSFGRGAVDFARIRVGDYVWKNKDPALDNRLKSYAEKDDQQLVDVRVEAFGKLGDPLEIRITTSEDEVDPSRSNIAASGFTASPLVAASNRPIEKADIEKAVGLLGDTPFRLHDLSVNALQKQLFVPMTEIKAARRDAVSLLLETRRKHNRGVGVDESAKYLPMLRREAAAVAGSMSDAEKAEAAKDLDDLEQILEDDAPKLSLLCRTPTQATAACHVPFLNEIVLDFLEVHGLRESVAEVRRAGKVVVVATPRIIKPDEGKLYSFYLRLKADAILVRSAGFLNQLLELGGTGAFVAASNCTIPDLRGDFSLNAANAISAGVFLRNGLQRIAPTHDLNAVQICDLARFLAADDDGDNSKRGHKRASSKIEVILHQHLAVFHTDHCVFARFLSDGNSFRDCGHPCETNHVHLRAMSDGQDHLVLADQGCRNTVFNAQAQSGGSYVDAFLDAGIRHFRIELVDEPASVVLPLLEKYLAVCQGVQGAAVELSRFLTLVPNGNGDKQGFGPGSLAPNEEIAWSKLRKTAAEVRASNSK